MEERRRFKRYPLYCPVEYKPEGGPRDSSITMNISEAGALISTKRQMNVSDALIIKIFLKDEDKFVRARVVHVQRELTIGLYSVGIEFVDKTADFLMKFYDELEAIMLYKRQVGEAAGRDLSLAEASMRWYRNSPQWA